MPSIYRSTDFSPLTADAPRAASAAHPLAASYPSPNLTRGARGEGWGECLSGSAVTYPAPTALDQKSFRPGGSGGVELKGIPVHVHCIANCRVSAFFYRYCGDVLCWDDANARAELEALWHPEGVRATFIA